MSLAPDCGIALWKRPRALGIASSAPTLIPPALSPKIVTLSGSPPNAAMLSLTQRSAITWSASPSAPVPGNRPSVASRRFRNPNAPSR